MVVKGNYESFRENDFKTKVEKVRLVLPNCFDTNLLLAFGLAYAGLSQAWNIVIIVCVLFLLFGLFMMTCSALDKRKEKKLKESGKKDPFAD